MLPIIRVTLQPCEMFPLNYYILQVCKVLLSIDGIKWWDYYLRRFNYVKMLYPSDPLNLPLDQLQDTEATFNCGDAQVLSGGAYFSSQYWSQHFPGWLQSTIIPIHIKEFWVVMVSAWLWGNKWTEKLGYIFPDSDTVMDLNMLELLQEFLYIVWTRKFTPVLKKSIPKLPIISEIRDTHHVILSLLQTPFSNC